MTMKDKVSVSMIAAIGRNRELGKKGDLLWHIPEDLAHFKALTQGAPVVMGRKTWESLPQAFRPLPGRTNIVVTRNEAYGAVGAVVVHSLDEGIALAQAQKNTSGNCDNKEIFIIGGAQLYTQGLAVVDTLYLTHVHAEDVHADTFFPPYEDVFTQTARDEHDNGTHRFSFVTYHKK